MSVVFVCFNGQLYAKHTILLGKAYTIGIKPSHSSFYLHFFYNCHEAENKLNLTRDDLTYYTLTIKTLENSNTNTIIDKLQYTIEGGGGWWVWCFWKMYEYSLPPKILNKRSSSGISTKCGEKTEFR